MKKVILRLKGGLGNQLFSYSAARRLAVVSGAELVLDSETGFADDHRFKEHYALDRFHISARLATARERMEPFARHRRRALKWISRRRVFEKRSFIEEESQRFDQRLLDLRVVGTVYLEGYWQSERYFRDIIPTIRRELRIIPPVDDWNRAMAQEIRGRESVGIHVRWFDAPGSAATGNLSTDYYLRAIERVKEDVKAPHFFLFSDQPEAAAERLALPEREMTVVGKNGGQASAYADLWLMTHCRHFICANSTFSWWGAWLGENVSRTVIAPDVGLPGATWTFPAEVPETWVTL